MRSNSPAYQDNESKQDQPTLLEEKGNLAHLEEKKDLTAQNQVERESSSEWESVQSSPSAAGRSAAYRLFPETQFISSSSFSSALTLPPSSLQFLSSSPQSKLTYASLSKLRKWSGHCRDRICPPSSYSVHSRASRTIIDAFGCVGYASIALLRSSDYYNRSIACEGNLIWRKAIKANLDTYQLENRVTISSVDFYQFFVEQYSIKSPQAIIYIDPDIPSSPSLTPNHDKNDYLYSSSPFNCDCTSLSSYLAFLLNHPLHPVPLIVIKFPLQFDSVQFKKNIEMGGNIALREWKQEKEIGKEEGIQFIAMAATITNAHTVQTTDTRSSTAEHSSASAASDSLNISSNSLSTIPRAQSRRQLLYLLSQSGFSRSVSSQPANLNGTGSIGQSFHLYLRFKQLMATQLYRANKAQQLLWQYVHSITHTPLRTNNNTNIQNASQRVEDDELIYDLLREYYHEKLLFLPECREIRERKEANKKNANVGGITTDADGRANSRVEEILKFIQSHSFQPNSLHSPSSSASFSANSNNNGSSHSLLDIGCSEGSITASLAQRLGIPKERAHGCDVRELKIPNSITFTLLTGELLPYKNEEFSVITALMSFHHIPTVMSTLRECFRVMKRGGLLIVREHDLTSPELSVVIDVMHGLYARVWSSPPEQPEFCESYFADYQNRNEWKQRIQSVGFQQCHNSPDREAGNPVQGKRKEGGGGRRNEREEDAYIVNPFEFYYGLYEKVAWKEDEIRDGRNKRERNEEEQQLQQQHEELKERPLDIDPVKRVKR